MIAKTFSDVLIPPAYSNIPSRPEEVSLTSNMGPFSLDLPLISANMRDITGPSMCEAMYQSGGLGILHRFNSIDEAVEDYVDAVDRIVNLYVNGEDICEYIRSYGVGVSIGVNLSNDADRAKELYQHGARLFCVDVAHGHHDLVRKAIEFLKGLDSGIYVIAGNIATYDAAKDLADWGADCVKVGIGPGSVCQTRNNTGVGVPQLYALEQVAMSVETMKEPVKIICDGGIKTTGDIVKALIYSDAVMVGSFISGTSETPNHVWTNENGEFYKTYGGSASAERKVANGGKKQFVEGMVKTVPFRGHVKYILKEAKENVQSGLSYRGARTLKEFRDNIELLNISDGGRIESKIKG